MIRSINVSEGGFDYLALEEKIRYIHDSCIDMSGEVLALTNYFSNFKKDLEFVKEKLFLLSSIHGQILTMRQELMLLTQDREIEIRKEAFNRGYSKGLDDASSIVKKFGTKGD